MKFTITNIQVGQKGQRIVRARIIPDGKDCFAGSFEFTMSAIEAAKYCVGCAYTLALTLDESIPPA